MQKTSTNSSKTVLIAMTGRVDSTVAAYLLKKQGFKCIGIGISMCDHDCMLKGDCQIDDMQKVKEICTFLEMPFYAVNGKSVFSAQVMDFVVARRLSGQTFAACTMCSKLIIQILLEKLKILSADFVATGHYAKINLNHKTNEYSLISANDEKSDQTYVLSRLDQDELSKLIFPLADIRQTEVEKIAKSLPLELPPRRKKRPDCFMKDSRLPAFTLQASSRTLCKSGNIMQYVDDIYLAEHDGVQNFYVGQSDLAVNSVDQDYEVIAVSMGTGKVYVADKKRLKYKNFQITNFLSGKNFDRSRPLNTFVKLSYDGPNIPCLVMFKNNDHISIELDKEYPGQLVTGQCAVFYNKPGVGAKIIGSGFVLASKDFKYLIVKDSLDDEELFKESSDGFKYGL